MDWHSTTLARGTSRGMNKFASSPARAAYAAKALAALPADGAPNFFTPSSLAMDTAAAMPRALKVPVGFALSSLTKARRQPKQAARRGVSSSGVMPSPRVTR